MKAWWSCLVLAWACVLLGGGAVMAEEPAPQSADDSIGENPPLRTFFGLYQPYLADTTGYQPIYFLFGTDPKKSKFQLSFKYQFYDPQDMDKRAQEWLSGIHFGYTQTSFWDLKSDSKPFDDTSYKPEFFHISPNLRVRPSWLAGLFIQSGYQHESNGKGAEESRSLDIVYVRPIFIFYNPKTRLGLEIAPKLWAYVTTGEYNTDIARYRGYFELEVKLGRADSLVLGSLVRWASEGASLQLDLTYPLGRHLFRSTHVYLQAQYANALAESLIEHRQRTEAVRLGVAIVR